MADAWLRCMITPGQFSCEYSVEGKLYGGEGFSLFACDYDLKIPSSQCTTGRTPGLIRVQVLKSVGSRAMVQLPKSTMENGDIVTVDVSDLKTTVECAEPVS
jgi:hypothetical protein